MRHLLTIIFLFPIATFGQKSFTLPDSTILDTTKYLTYKIFFVHPNIDYKISPTQTQLFKIDTSIYKEVEKAITDQYVSANSIYLDLEEAKNPYPHQSMDTTKLTTNDLKKLRRKKILAASQKTVEKDILKYDRYYFGFTTQQGDKWIYIMFDPHKIKYFNLGGERHISNLSPLVYNLATKKLYLAGWTGHGE
jgi:hypothetical protein